MAAFLGIIAVGWLCIAHFFAPCIVALERPAWSDCPPPNKEPMIALSTCYMQSISDHMSP